MPSRTTVSSSLALISAPPSPSAATARRSGLRERGADRGRQAQPDRLERLGEAVAELVGNGEVGMLG